MKLYKLLGRGGGFWKGGPYLQGSSTNLNVPVPKLSSPQREQRPESIRFPKYLHPAGVSYSASFMALATLKPHRKKETYCKTTTNVLGALGDGVGDGKGHNSNWILA